MLGIYDVGLVDCSIFLYIINIKETKLFYDMWLCIHFHLEFNVNFLMGTPNYGKLDVWRINFHFLDSHLVVHQILVT